MIHIEVRKKTIDAQEKGLTNSEIAKAYNYSDSAINRLLKQYRENRDINPKTHLRGRKPALDAQGLEAMRQLILAKPDITLKEIKAKITRARQTRCSRKTQAVARNGLGRKHGFARLSG